MSTQGLMKELDPAVMELLRQRGRMPVSELAKAMGTSDSDATFASLKDISDLILVGDEVVRKLSPEEQADLKTLEAKVHGGQRESAAVLREIRDRRLYRAPYATFDLYLQIRWHRTRQWAAQLLNWLRRIELLEQNGKDPYQSLTVDDAQALGPLEEHPEEFVAALEEAEEEASRSGKKRNKSHIKDAVKRRTDFLGARTNLDMPDLTYEEARALAPLGITRMSNPNLVEEARTKSQMEGLPLNACLLEACQSRQSLPTDKQLLAVARGKDLEDLVQPLAAAKTHWDEVAELKEQRRKLEDELEEIDKQIAPSTEPAQPQGKRAQWLAPHPSSAASEAEEEEDSREKSEEKAGPSYRVLLSGAFEEIVNGCLWEGSAEMQIDADNLPEFFGFLAEKLGEGFEITEESSITVVPLMDEEMGDDEDETTEEPEEDLNNDDEDGDE